MEKKTDKGFYIIVGILTILVIILILLTAVLLLGGKGEKKEGENNAGPFVIEDSEVKNSEKDSSNSFSEEPVKDAPDSTMSDIITQTTEEDIKPGEGKEESTMSLEGGKTTFLVPENFYSEGQKVTEDFVSGDYKIYVSCSLQKAGEETDLRNARACIETEWDFLFDSVKDKTKIKTIDMNGTTFYYIEIHYEYDGTDTQRVYAACDIGENAIYKVEAGAMNEDVELSIDTIRDFLVLK